MPRIVSYVVLFQINNQVIQTKHRSDCKIQRRHSIVQMTTQDISDIIIQQLNGGTREPGMKKRAKQNRISKET